MSGRKSAKRAGTFKKGGDPRQGRGPKPGAPNAGRPTDDFKALARALADRHELLAMFAQLAAKKSERTADRIAAGRLVLEYGYGKPTQPLSADVDDDTDITFRIVKRA